MGNRVKVWTPERIEYFMSIYKEYSMKEVSRLISDKFDCEITFEQVKAYCSRKKLRNGRDGRFAKGSIPHNKGKKGKTVGRMAETQFKKGESNRRLPVGTERIDTDGYTVIKIANPSVWKFKHRWIYENEYGPIGKGNIVIFLDGDKSNIKLSNLRLVSTAENAMLNHEKRRSNNPVITDAMINLVKLKLAANKKRKSG